MANANPERVYNALNPSEYSEIANYTASIRTAIANSQTSIQSVCMERDETGIPTAYNSTPNTAIMHSDTSISTGFKPNIETYSIEETITGELQDFGGEVSKQATAVDINWTDNGDGTYTGNGGSGFISIIVSQLVTTGYSIIKITDYVSGAVSLPYTGSGARQEKSGDGVHSGVADIGANGYIYGTAFEGTIEVLSIKELTTKTQRTEQRLLTHTDNHLGSELHTAIDLALTVADETITYTKNSDTSFSLSIDVVGTNNSRPLMINTGTTTSSSVAVLTFNAVVNSGIPKINRIISSGFDNTIDYTVVNGANTIQLDGIDDLTVMSLYWNGTNLFDISVTNWSIQEVSTQNKYYIDGLEQAVIPPLPDPAVTINLNDTAVIGYPDTIDRRDADFKVYTDVRTAANALEDYNTWVLTYKDVLTDGNGDYLTDGDGRYLYT